MLIYVSEPKHTVQEIKQYISDKHLKYKQEKLEELADLLGNQF